MEPNAFNLNKFNQLVASKKKGYSNFLIIPGSGCQGCISDAEQFVIQKAKTLEDKILIVFTNIGSEKLLKLRLGPELSKGPNILLDANDDLHYTSIYPVYFKLENGDILNFKPLKVNDIYTLEVE